MIDCGDRLRYDKHARLFIWFVGECGGDLRYTEVVVVFAYKTSMLLKAGILSALFFLTGYGEVLCRQVVVVTAEYPPFNYTEKGAVKGISTNIVRSLLDTLEIDAKITSYPWTRSYKKALEEKNTLIYPLVRTPEREGAFEWIGVVATGKTYLYSLQTRHDIDLQSLDDAKKKSIGVLRGAVRFRYLKTRHFTNLVEDISPRASAQKLILGWIDLWAADENTAYYTLSMMGYDPRRLIKRHFPLDIELDGYLAFSKDSDRELVESFRKAFIRLQVSGEYEKMIKTPIPDVQE